MEREVIVVRGPRFFRAPEAPEMFEHVIDGGSSIGPRIATEDDKRAHAAAYQAFKSLETGEGGYRAEQSKDPRPKTFGTAVAEVITGTAIPQKWEELSVKDRQALASRIARREVKTAGEADMIIKSEVAKS